MRPIRLRLSAFGPFAGTEEVDFESLAPRGLFVVAGPTGTGKTTIFDAMSWALYGQLPGDRSAESIRSQHAKPNDKTGVEFEFEMEGRRWKVVRHPAWLRPKQRGTGSTEEKASASLEEQVGGRWAGRASSITEVNRLCAEILGLGPDHFQRVVLLPQGKFQQFLVSDTRSRRELLSRVFGTSLFAKAVERLKDTVVEARRAVDQLGIDVEHQRGNARAALTEIEDLLGTPGETDVVGADAAPDSAGEEEQDIDGPRLSIEQVEARLDEAESAVRAARESADARARQSGEAERRVGAAKIEAGRWDQLAALRSREAALLPRQEDMRKRAEAIAAADRAEPVVSAVRKVAEAESGLGIARRARDEAADQWRVDVADLGLEPVADEAAGGARTRVSLEEERLRARRRNLHELAARTRAELEENQSLVESRGKRDKLLAAQRGLVERMQALDQESAALRPVADPWVAKLRSRDDLERRRDAIAERIALIAKLAEERRSAALLEEKAAAGLEAYLADGAAALAGQLAPGEPCPVCGSREHPSPAAAGPGGRATDRKTVENDRRAASEARALIAAGELRLGELEAGLGDDVATSAEDATARWELALREAGEAERAVSRLRAIESERPSLQSELDGLGGSITSVTSEVTKFEERHARIRDELAALREQVGGDDDARLDEVEAVLRRAGKTVSNWETSEATLRGATSVLDDRRASLAQALESSGWPDVDAAIAASMAPDLLERERREVEAFRVDLTDVYGQLRPLVEQPPPAERPDVETLRAVAERLGLESAGLATRANSLAGALARGRGAIEEARAVDEQGREVRERHALADRVHKTCDGKGLGRVALETWVLASELQRVAAAASVHLQRMTSNRYRLERRDRSGHGNAQAGLDLVVRDSHTGLTRDTATLSGGEQFQASLALALGLADVVSRGGRASGHVYRALFVDEGFGSLDERSLDQALSTLDHLRAGGRMVGVITHVELMKQNLPVGIEVQPRPDGTGSTLRVNGVEAGRSI